MFKTPLQYLTGASALVLVTTSTILICTPLLLVALLKLALPWRPWREVCSSILVHLAEAWISVNGLLMRVLLPTQWQVSGLQGLEANRSYLLICNHQSWVDIPVLQKIFNRKIPFLRFFLKQQLIWIPFLGVAWWALDFPFMRRYSKAALSNNPQLRGADLAATRNACEKYRGRAVTVMNFVEGTRFSAEKHARQESPYRHLLRPKPGGLAFVLGAMGSQIDALIDVTIHYPQGAPDFWEFACGKVRCIDIHVEVRSPDSTFLTMDYAGDEVARARFRSWLDDLWQAKDARLDRLARSMDGSHNQQEYVIC